MFLTSFLDVGARSEPVKADFVVFPRLRVGEQNPENILFQHTKALIKAMIRWRGEGRIMQTENDSVWFQTSVLLTPWDEC